MLRTALKVYYFQSRMHGPRILSPCIWQCTCHCLWRTKPAPTADELGCVMASSCVSGGVTLMWWHLESLAQHLLFHLKLPWSKRLTWCRVTGYNLQSHYPEDGTFDGYHRSFIHKYCALCVWLMSAWDSSSTRGQEDKQCPSAMDCWSTSYGRPLVPSIDVWSLALSLLILDLAIISIAFLFSFILNSSSPGYLRPPTSLIEQ